MKQTLKIDFYFSPDDDINRPSMAVLEVNGDKHFSADIRLYGTEMTICLSRKTLPPDNTMQGMLSSLLSYSQILIVGLVVSAILVTVTKLPHFVIIVETFIHISINISNNKMWAHHLIQENN